MTPKEKALELYENFGEKAQSVINLLENRDYQWHEKLLSEYPEIQAPEDREKITKLWEPVKEELNKLIKP